MSWFILKIIVLFVLLLLSGFFAGSETALIRMGRVKARSLLKSGVKGADTVQKLVNEPDAFLTTVLIGNNVVNIAASALATSIAIEYFGDFGVGIAMGVMTFLILTFGEIIPKTFAVYHAERISIAVSKPLEILIFVLRPVIKVLSVMTNAFGKMLGVKMQQRGLLSEEEVKTFLDIGEEDGAIEEDEKEMINGVLKLDYITVENVMTQKEDMVCLEAHQSVDSAVELIKKYGYSRIPVFEGTEDNIVGILYARDLLINANDSTIPLKKLMKSAYFVPETARVDDLLKEFREGKFHIAIVVDEEGRTKGLISLEDLLEEIVGSIYDEYDVRKIKS
ncbi:MAG TPA: CNNM domain-containing protein [Candidatus Bathyarchaeia archaeon]|nr:CNNM domain-containing protein [Candidatus Bathyarchaeia archaeon]